MPQYENIEGSRRIELLKELRDDRTFLQLTLPESDYNNLTIITRILDEGNNFSFLIDTPKGLHKAIADTEAQQLFFEFSSKDRVTHRFHADIATVSQDGVLCQSPPSIERYQQRDNFRVRAVYPCQAEAHIDDAVIEMEIDNVSLGGVYCYCRNEFKSLFEKGANLEDMELSFTLQDDCMRIPIQLATVNRVEPRHRPRQFGIAFEFIRISQEARQHLVQQIYELQREFLQNRVKMTD
jgi:c-di-GMP-binding flagellar brake protein YcgR